MKLETRTDGNRTTFHDSANGKHVATIIEQLRPHLKGGKMVAGLYWYAVRDEARHAESYGDAESRINDLL